MHWKMWSLVYYCLVLRCCAVVGKYLNLHIIMELIQVDAREFANVLPAQGNIYSSVPFTELNRHKCREVAYLLFRDTRLRGGLVTGLRDGIWRSPFSAPFGGLVLSRTQRVEEVEEMYRLAIEFACNGADGLRVTLPPEFMDAALYAKSVNVLTRFSGGCGVPEINYHVDLRGIVDPVSLYSRSAREKLRQAQRLPFRFEQLEVAPENIARVYDVIHQNRMHRGFPHNMTLAEVTATASVIPMDLFMLTLDGVPAAAAQVHHIASGVVQVVYWGDMPGMSAARPMNLLPLEIYRHYLSRGDIDFIDIGHSTEDGQPNYGLCEYKESVGCRASIKWSFDIHP